MASNTTLRNGWQGKHFVLTIGSITKSEVNTHIPEFDYFFMTIIIILLLLLLFLNFFDSNFELEL